MSFERQTKQEMTLILCNTNVQGPSGKDGNQGEKGTQGDNGQIGVQGTRYFISVQPETGCNSIFLLLLLQDFQGQEVLLG